VVDFGRVITAMITPFKEDGSVNYAVAEQLAAYLAEQGTDSLVICGTTGESPTLSWEEEYQLFQVAIEAVAGKALVIAGTGSNSTEEAIAIIAYCHSQRICSTRTNSDRSNRVSKLKRSCYRSKTVQKTKPLQQ